jgi:hypothetical protein
MLELSHDLRSKPVYVRSKHICVALCHFDMLEAVSARVLCHLACTQTRSDMWRPSSKFKIGHTKAVRTWRDTTDQRFQYTIFTDIIECLRSALQNTSCFAGHRTSK